MKEGTSACWHYSIVWWFPHQNSTHNSCKLDVQWHANFAITTTLVLTVLTSISLFHWATFFLHEEICVCLPLQLCMVRNQWDAKWYHIFPYWKMWDINVYWFENKRVHFVNSLGRDYKTIKAAFTNWTEQHFISCVFDLRCCVENISLHAKNLLGLWSISSTTNAVKTFEQSFIAQNTPSDSNCVYTLSPSCVDKTNIWSSDIDKPKSWNLSTSKRLHVWKWNKKGT